MKTKNLISLLILLTVIIKSVDAQLLFVDKSFTNDKEWRLNFKIGDAYYSDSYNYCSSCMDQLVAMTKDIDKMVVEIGLKCYDKTHQTDKIKKLIANGFLAPFSPRQLCRMKLSASSKSLPLFKKCEAIDYQTKKTEVVSNEGLRDRLINMLIADQYNRSLVLNTKMAELGYEVHNDYLENHTQRQLDSLNFKQLKEILANHGFPRKEEIGTWAMQAVFLIIQHSGVEFQLKYKEQIDQAFERGDLNAFNYATMIDRIEMNQGNKQIYGMQAISNEKGLGVISPMIDPERVNERRMKIGLIPLEGYMLKFNYHYQ